MGGDDSISDGTSAFKYIISGTISGFVQVAVGHPLDTMKVRMQTSSTTANPMFSGMADLAREILAKEGIAGLYAGAASPLLGAMAHNATKFFSYGMAKQVVGGGQELTVPQYYIAGSLAAFPISMVESPVDLFKIKMQVPKPEYDSVIDCGKKIFRKYGVVGVYQGLGATLLRNVTAFGLYFFTFEGIKIALTKKGEQPSLPVCFLAGSSAGAGFWGLFYPLETIKSRMQGDHVNPTKRLYSGIIDCARKTAKEGRGAFYRGFAPCIIRAMPANGAVLTCFTATQRVLNRRGGE